MSLCRAAASVTSCGNKVGPALSGDRTRAADMCRSSRCGPSRSTGPQDDGTEVVIHAMRMRSSYESFLHAKGESDD